MKPKLRIKLYRDDDSIESDRLVDQYSEFLQGPPESWPGPFSLEVLIDSKETLSRAVQYMEKLAGNLPLSNKLHSKSKLSTRNNSMNAYKILINQLKSTQYIEDLINYIESVNFRWINWQYLEELHKLDRLSITLPDKMRKGVDLSEYQWATRFLRHAKDPMNDKFDFTLLIGVKWMGHLSKRVIIIYKGKKFISIVREWKKGKTINIKERKILTTFPAFMSIEERILWRKLHRKIEMNREIGIKDRAFYEKCLPHIKNLKKN